MKLKIQYDAWNKAQILMKQGLVDNEKPAALISDDTNTVQDWDAYAQNFLCEDTDNKEKTKERYLFPFLVDGKVSIKSLQDLSTQNKKDNRMEIHTALQNLLKDIASPSAEVQEAKHSDEIRKVSRNDYIPMHGDWMVEKMEVTNDGYFRGRAIVTRTGVFEYIQADGTIFRELRTADEVFHPDSLNTLDGIPITYNHPDERVTPENVKDVQVGSTGSVEHDMYFVSARLSITDKDVIASIGDDSRALSCGYTADVYLIPGDYRGIKYDGIQKNIRYNHVAICKEGRAGEYAVMKIDGIPIEDQKFVGKNQSPKEDKMKVVVDQITYDDSNKAELEQTIITTHKRFADEKAVLEKQIVTDKAAHDQVIDERDSLKKKVEELSKADHSKEVNKAVEAYLEIAATAYQIGMKIDSRDSARKLKEKVIREVFPDTKADLGAANDDYVDARYDGAVDFVNSTSYKSDVNTDLANDTIASRDANNEVEKSESQKARDRMIEDQVNAYKRPGNRNEGGK